MIPVLDRLMAKVEPLSTGCWLWRGATTAGGYGKIGLGGRRAGERVAHRVTYELMVGSIPTGYDLDHLCRLRACVNPTHVEPVTRRENVRRGLWGPGQPRTTHCRHGHEYTPDNTRQLAGGRRRCRECLRIARREYENRRYHSRRAMGMTAQEARS